MPPDSSPRGYTPPETRRQPEPRPRPVEQPVAAVEITPAKKSGGLNMVIEDGSTMEVYDFGWHVMDRYREPEMTDSDLALRIIEERKGQELAMELNRFSNLSHEVAHRLINLGQSTLVGRNIERFDPTVHKEIAIDLIKAGRAQEVLANDKKFQHLDKDVFIAILSVKHHEDIEIIMNDVYIKKFEIDPNEAMEILFEKNLPVPDLTSITGLNKESAMLIALEKPATVLKNRERFSATDAEIDQAIFVGCEYYAHIHKDALDTFFTIFAKSPNTAQRYPKSFGRIFRVGRSRLAEGRFTSISGRLNLFQKLQEFNPTGMKEDPWPEEPIMDQLLKLQAQSSNEEHDPWKTDLDPLVQHLEENGYLHFDKKYEADILVDFVKRFGMNNTPVIAEIFFELQGFGYGVGLSGTNAERLSAFLGKRVPEFSRDKTILFELEQKQRWFLAELLRDQIPAGIETQIGMELLGLIKGSTKWNQKDKPSDLIETWKRTATEHPELAKLPEHYVEYELEIPLVVRKKEVEGEKTLEEKQAEVLALKEKNEDGKEVPTELGLYLNRLFNGFSASLYFGTGSTESEKFQKLNMEILQTLFKEIHEDFDIDQKLEQRKQRLVAKGIKGDRLEKGLDAARRSFTVQKAKAEKLLDAIATIGEPPTFDKLDEENENKFVAYMEAIAHVLPPGKKSAELLIGLTVEHLKRVKNLDDFVSFQLHVIKEILAHDARNLSISLEHFGKIADTFVDYISEHYLQPKQDAAHTGHVPFSPELLRALEHAWQRTRNDPTEKNVLVRTREKLAALESGNIEETGKTKKISLVPAKGIMRIFSGDTGDACFTSQHEELAEGEYPGLTAYSFVVNRNMPSERVQGSTLFIETRTNDRLEILPLDHEKTVLIVRANNPRENLLRDLNADKLIEDTLATAIDLAKARRLDMVCVPLDDATQSSSNRSQVSAYYKKHYGTARRINLVDTPETNFNGYDNWDTQGNHPVVVVWEQEK